jgi:hypothetical protein
MLALISTRILAAIRYAAAINHCNDSVSYCRSDGNFGVSGEPQPTG